MTLPARQQSAQLLEKYVKNEALRHHCRMVARAMEVYAKELGEDAELWYQTGLLHDLDWEQTKDNAQFREQVEWELRAIRAHATMRTGQEPETLLDKYLFACDELSGFMHAVSLMRPNKFADMKPKSVKKKLKDVSFAANVDREEINKGFTLIGKTPDEHISFLIEVFKKET